MNAKELMIGDVFLYPDDEGFVAVSVVKFDRDAVRVKRNDGHMFNIVPELLQPEQIVPGLLELFGFKPTPNGLLLMLDGTNHILVQYDDEHKNVKYVEIFIADKIDIRARNIQYIHQLQHIIRFCDIDGFTM